MRYYYYDVFIPENDADAKRDLEKYVAESNSIMTMESPIHHKARHLEEFGLRVPEIDSIDKFRKIIMGVNPKIECRLTDDRVLHKIGSRYQGEEA
jgi:hypothetical protein